VNRRRDGITRESDRLEVVAERFEVAGAEHRDHPDQLRQEVGPSKERSATASNGRVARGELIARKVLASEWFGMQDGAETLEGLSGPGVGLVPSADSAKRAPIETLWCSGRDYDL
jgi:hypothetical protein